jgi:hypothetical protein
MPTFTIKKPWGQSYTIDGPEGSTQEQAEQELDQQLRGSQDNPIGQAAAVDRDRSQPGIKGMVARGLTGFAQGEKELGASALNMVGVKPGAAYQIQENTPNVSPVEKLGRGIGRAGVPLPGGPIAQAVGGGVTGALQPADNWTDRAKNAAIGAGSASGLGALARSMSPSQLSHLLGAAGGAALGYGHGPMEMLFGTGIGERLGGYVPLGRLAQWFATQYPGAAAEMGIGGANLAGKIANDQGTGQSR